LEISVHQQNFDNPSLKLDTGTEQILC
jgi:hypothetical protein